MSRRAVMDDLAEMRRSRKNHNEPFMAYENPVRTQLEWVGSLDANYPQSLAFLQGYRVLVEFSEEIQALYHPG